MAAPTVAVSAVILDALRRRATEARWELGRLLLDLLRAGAETVRFDDVRVADAVASVREAEAAVTEAESAAAELERLRQENAVLRGELDGFLPPMDGRGTTASGEALQTNAALRSLVAAWQPVVRAADAWQGAGGGDRAAEAKLLEALYGLTDAQREAAR